MTIEIIAFTDPVCTWCWGTEPVLRALQTRYGDQVHISYVMGGLVKDIRQFRDAGNAIGGDPASSNRNIVAHWLDASQRHGMPVKAAGFKLFTDDHPSTYPLNEAYLAARQQGEDLSNAFLRRLREASAAEARQTNRIEVLAEVAAEAGLDTGMFLTAMRDGSAATAFQQDLAITAAHGVRGFPAFIVKGQAEKGLMLPGYQTYGAFREVISLVSQGTAVETTLPKDASSVVELIRRWGSVTDIEITTALDLTDEEWGGLERQVTADPSVAMVPAGNGRFFRSLAPMAGTCDPATAVCAV